MAWNRKVVFIFSMLSAYNFCCINAMHKPFYGSFSPFCTATETDLCLWNNPVQASQRKIPILVDAERKREGLDELLNFASYVVCSAKFPQVSCWIAKRASA